MEKHDFLRASFYQLLIVYLILVVLSFFKIIPYYHYEILALIAALIGIFTLKEKEDIKIKRILLIIPFFIIIITRIIPYLKYDLPLGFDAGIYKYLIEHSGVLSGYAEPSGFYTLTQILLIFLKTDFILKYILILLEILIGLFVFLNAKKYFNEKAGFFSLLVYSLSVVQFKAFSFLYYKQILALFILLIITYYLEKRFIVITGGAYLSGVHTPTFLIFIVSYIVFSLKDFKKHFINIVLIGLLGSGFYLTNLELLKPLQNIENIGAGNFITITGFLFLSLGYILFSVLGFFTVLKEKKINIIVILAFLTGIVVLLKLFFFNRYIISFDLLLILFSGYGIVKLMEDKKKSIIIVVILLIFSCFSVFNESLSVKPEISEEKLEEIMNLPEGLILTERKYAPWILAYKGKVVAPLLFGDNSTKEEWDLFFNGENEEILIKYKPDIVYVDNKLDYDCLKEDGVYFRYSCDS